MARSQLKLLLNAEPFGFGPTAAIATFFPYIRETFEYVGYIGRNHTLDLQISLPYEAIHDVSNVSNEEIKKIICQYDVLVTALDFEIAEIAKSAGLKVIIYDPLAWYWRSIPKIVREIDLYLAQDFFGVRQRIEKDAGLFPKNIKIVPPIVTGKRGRISKRFTLISLGGLQNPLWSVDDALQYAKTFIEAIKECVSKDDELIIATSNAIVERLNDPGIRSYSRAEMISILENTKYAFMTSGLGNIYDVAEFDIPVIWLPPANDSQGQQITLLKNHNMSDGQIDWSDLGGRIDYFDEQAKVLKGIKEMISLIDHDFIVKAVRQNYDRISKKEISIIASLLDEFGVNGAQVVGESIFEYCKSKI